MKKEIDLENLKKSKEQLGNWKKNRIKKKIKIDYVDLEKE